METNKLNIEMRVRLWGAGIIGGLVIASLGLSLAHLANGVSTLTGDNWILAFALAVIIDIGIISVEGALIIGQLYRLNKIFAPTWILLIVGVIFSIYLNGRGYTEGKELYSEDWFAGWGFGAFIPLSAFGFAKIIAILIIGNYEPPPPPAPAPSPPVEDEAGDGSPETLAERREIALAMLHEARSLADIAEETGLSLSTLYRYRDKGPLREYRRKKKNQLN